MRSLKVLASVVLGLALCAGTAPGQVQRMRDAWLFYRAPA